MIKLVKSICCPWCILSMLVIIVITCMGCGDSQLQEKEPEHRINVVFSVPDPDVDSWPDPRSRSRPQPKLEFDSWPDQELEMAFHRYWNLRHTGVDSHELLTYEAPHFRKMVNKEAYSQIVNRLIVGRVEQITIGNMIRVTDSLFQVFMEIKLVDRKGEQLSYTNHERWVKVQGEWYHLWRNPVLFQGL